MRTLLKVHIPTVVGSRAVSDGTLPRVMSGFMERHKPEAAYFYAEGGERTALFVFDLKDPSDIPVVAEPFFSQLEATIEACPVMNAADMQAGVQKAVKG